MSAEGPTKDTVILHQTGRAKYAPSLSPFAMKVETYLRMTNTPYKSVHGKKKSPKGKVPWIEYNSEVVSDSYFIIEFLNKKLDIDLQKDLSDEQKAIGKAFQRLVEENLYWTLLYARNVDKEFTSAHRENLPKGFMMDLTMWRGKGQVQKALQSHGIGRHSRDEIYQIAENDIRALSNYLGENQFFFGEGGTEIDASIFGLLAAFAYELPGSPQEKLLKGDCKNLLDYCERMKEKYWPDWDKCIMGDVPITSFPAVPESDPTVLKIETKESKKKDKKATENDVAPPAAEGEAVTNGVENGTGEETKAESNEQAEGEKATENGEKAEEATDKTKSEEEKDKTDEPTQKDDAKAAESPAKVEKEAENVETKEETTEEKKEGDSQQDEAKADATANGTTEEPKEEEKKEVNSDEQK